VCFFASLGKHGGKPPNPHQTRKNWASSKPEIVKIPLAVAGAVNGRGWICRKSAKFAPWRGFRGLAGSLYSLEPLEAVDGQKKDV
jgi:hypothetical protein